ncbi:MAG: hypothetical protein ABSE93_28635 [Terriglobia bacterium]
MLPRPTVELVEAECKAFDLENWLAEEALGQLRAQFPLNTDIRHVLLKVLVLNKLYGTMIRDIEVETVAKHIVGLGIDPLLAQGSLQAVTLITDCPNVRQYLSFASKFCSWHNPTAYPIYDGNVRECLSLYQKQDSFAQFRNKEDLYYYQKLFDAVLAFRSHYGLNSLTFKQLDKFMYRVGGQILKARKGQKGQAPAI